MKTARRIFFVLLAVALVSAGIIAGWYAVENYRGAREWADTRRALEAHGASFDLAHFIPAPVPDDQNLALAPFFVRLYQYRVDPVTGVLTFSRAGNTHAADTVDAIPFGSKGEGANSGPGWPTGRAMSLEKLQAYYRSRRDFPSAPSPQSPGADVRLALTRFDPLLAEIEQEAANRPEARFPVNWTQKPAALIDMPHGIVIQKLVHLLRLRAGASLALGEADLAFHDVVLGFHLRRTLARDPLLIANLVDVTCCGLLLSPVWDGLAARRWSSAQLRQLQDTLSEVDFFPNYQRAVQTERVLFTLPMLDALRQAKNLNNVLYLTQTTDDVSRWPRWMSEANRLFPRGWYDESKALVSRLDQRYAIDPIELEHHRIDARKIDAGKAIVRDLPMKPTTFMAKLSLPITSSVVLKIAYGQGSIDQAVVACALERFFLDHQSYPPGLDALVPAYLAHVPTDVIDGAPLRYQPTPEGRYRLWAVGWNGQDENGKTVWLKGTSRPDETKGDWVWQYEALPLPPDAPHGK